MEEKTALVPTSSGALIETLRRKPQTGEINVEALSSLFEEAVKNAERPKSTAEWVKDYLFDHSEELAQLAYRKFHNHQSQQEGVKVSDIRSLVMLETLKAYLDAKLINSTEEWREFYEISLKRFQKRLYDRIYKDPDFFVEHLNNKNKVEKTGSRTKLIKSRLSYALDNKATTTFQKIRGAISRALEANERKECKNTDKIMLWLAEDFFLNLPRSGEKYGTEKIEMQSEQDYAAFVREMARSLETESEASPLEIPANLTKTRREITRCLNRHSLEEEQSLTLVQGIANEDEFYLFRNTVALANSKIFFFISPIVKWQIKNQLQEPDSPQIEALYQSAKLIDQLYQGGLILQKDGETPEERHEGRCYMELAKLFAKKWRSECRSYEAKVPQNNELTETLLQLATVQQDESWREKISDLRLRIEAAAEVEELDS